LKKHGVEPIQTRDIAFDPNVHEAMMQVSRPDLEPGMVADEIEKGFMLNDRVLRPAKVTVSA
jgi:molecular chaperone GrpE